MRKFLEKKDLLVFFVFLAIVIFPFIVPKNIGNKVVVEGRDFKKILSKPGIYDIVENGKFLMKVEFTGEKVRVVESTCPLKICVKTGWVGPGGTIVCVPNEVIIYFEGKTDYDIETW
ncbi:NusG domain II-containing protein [Thermotoga sp. KOL6]|uniref:NusG domain II-containing protein n=1 Tax=Thermotoga sp. KOL6 TaxID=126741 RepID=UPI000C768236|nr:NusG domain II-containing protein [Thermotoga sp. KOL6]PLV60507.1 hypothetical protein AS005_03490 [Thermotoga sp. KOL6]